MHVSTHIDAAGVAELSLLGRLDVEAHAEFAAAWEAALARPEVRGLTLDMGDVEYVDSSGLGMLLVLHRAAAARRVDVTLRACRPHFRQVLRATNFTRLFRVEDRLCSGIDGEEGTR